MSIFYVYIIMCVKYAGGPQVHITMMHEEFVMKRKWIDDNMFSELLGIGQSIPGPTSSQVIQTQSFQNIIKRLQIDFFKKHGK